LIFYVAQTRRGRRISRSFKDKKHPQIAQIAQIFDCIWRRTPMTHLTIVRHGECLAQCDPAAARDPDSALSALGREQAQLAGERLAALQVTHIVSSPLVRALETATIIAEAVGIGPIEVWLQAREGFSHAHRADGRSILGKRFPTALLPMEIAEEGWDHGNDTFAGFFARAQETAALLKAQFAVADHVVLVTHGGFANYLLHGLLTIAPETPTWFELANGSLTRLRFPPPPAPDAPVWPLYPPVGVEVLGVNEVGHLALLIGNGG
jgi:broad specificity phosphatase PhoE